MLRSRHIHPSLKWIFTLYLLIFLPIYWIAYGAMNFLWISDIALFLIYLAILLESRTLASMAIVGDIAYTITWIIDFTYTLLFPAKAGFTKYMLNPAVPLGIRLLSLFHIALPFLMIWTIRRLGYDSKAWRYQIIFSTALLFFTWVVASPDKNINFAFGYEYLDWQPLPFLLLMSLANGIVVFVTHLTIKWMKNR